MEYVDKKGKTYEISYSQKLQREQNKIARQKNQLLYAILIVLVLFGLSAIWVGFRLANADILTRLVEALTAMA